MNDMSNTDDMFSMDIPEAMTTGIILNEEQTNTIKDILDKSNQNFFITGAAGSGK